MHASYRTYRLSIAAVIIFCLGVLLLAPKVAFADERITIVPNDEISSSQASSIDITPQATTYLVPVQGILHQTDARNTLDRVNYYRGKDGVGNVKWDSTMEQIAILRAYETAVYWSHTRPNGEKCTTAFGAFSDYPARTYLAAGVYGDDLPGPENIAYSSSQTPTQVVDSWYGSSGHRKTMCYSYYHGYAAACFESNGIKFWVEEFCCETGNGARGGWAADHGAADKVASTSDHIALTTKTGYSSENWSSQWLVGWERPSLLVGSTYSIGTADGTARGDARIYNMNTYTDTQGVVHHIYANLLPGWLSWETTIADGFGTSTSAATPHTDSNGNAWITANSAGSTQIRAYVPGLKGGNWYSNFYTTVTQPTIQSVSAGNLTYNGSAQTPSLTVTGSTGKTLTQGTDYKITSITNDMTNAGSKSVTVTGIGSYSGTKTATFSIDKCPIGNCFANIPDQTYTGSALTPDIDSDGLHCYSKKWVEGTDWYKGAYVNNVDSKAVSGSKAHLTVYGKGNFTGSMDVYFTINQRSIDTCWANIPDQTYTGSALTPDIDSNGINLYGTKWVEGTDWYKGAYVNNVDSKAVSGSKAHLTVYGKGNFTGSMDVYFTINQASLSNATITSPGNQTYTGSALTPKPAVKMGSKTLAQNNDYALSYSSNNVSAGNTVTITITGQNNYSGTAYTTFNIVAPSVANASVTVPSVTYSGTPQRPVPTSVTVGGTKLYLGTDYRISNYSNNTNAGTASLTITGLNNYAGSSKIVNFTINPAAITSYSFSTPTLTYNGYAQRPDVPSMATNMGTLHESSPDDYDITYSNNVNAGTAGIAFQFKNNFTGTGHSTFTIGKANISAAAVSGLQPTYSYTGFAIKPALTLRFGPNTLTEGTDYYLSYFNNTSAGTATIQITGTGTNFTGTTMRQFSITQNQVTNNLSAANIAAIPTQTFTGSAIRPALSVVCNGTALKQDTDYTVSYSNNIHAGTATVTVRGMGSYTGAKTTTFAIKSADPIRKAGLGALDTMEQIVDAGWTQSNCQTVVIATNGGYWDALSACSEAGLKGAPVILTNGGHLSAQARDEINRLGATNAVIIGGEGAITEDVVWQLETTTSISSVTRHAGASAADTARDIYENETGWGSTCIIATSDGFQDALAAAPFSYAKHAPMFLAESGSRTLSAQTLADIRDGGFTNVIIIGGECAVSPTVERQLSYAGVTGVTRIGGDTAYDTCQQFDEWALGQGMSVSRVGLATGEMYYDALAGAALCGKNNSVIALTSNGDSTVIDGIVRVNKAHVDQPYVFGGWGVVSDYTLAHLRSVLL